MGYFNRIKNSDTLLAAIQKKINQDSISDKTREKIKQKVLSLDKSRLEDQSRSARIEDVFKGVNWLGKQRGVVSQEIKDILLTNIISLGVQEVSHHLKLNKMPGVTLNLTDEMLMPRLIDLMAKKKNINNIKYFESLSSLFEFIKHATYEGSIVVKMTFDQYDNGNAHFTSAFLDVNNERAQMIFLESCTIQGNLKKIVAASTTLLHRLTGDRIHDRRVREEAMKSIEEGVSYGVVALQYHIQKFLKTRDCRFTSDSFLVNYCEMGLQNSYFDCAMYSLNIATRMARTPDGEFWDKLTTPVGKGSDAIYGIGFFFDSRLKDKILNGDRKCPIMLPAALKKHAQSLKVLQQSSDNIYNIEKEETLFSRVEKKRLIINREREDKPSRFMELSSSIERKREVYYNMLFGSIVGNDKKGF